MTYQIKLEDLETRLFSLETDVFMLQRADAYREILKLKEAGRFFSPDDDPAGFLEVAEGFEKMAADIRMRVEEAGRKKRIETNLLGGLFIDNELVPECVARLVPSDFQDEACRKIFSAIVDLHNNNEPVDLVTLTLRLKEKGTYKSVGGAVALMELIDAVPSACNLLEFIEMLRGKK